MTEISKRLVLLHHAGKEGRAAWLDVALGGAFLLVVDTLARSAARIEIPLGVLTAMLGTPLFLWLLARRPAP